MCHQAWLITSTCHIGHAWSRSLSPSLLVNDKHKNSSVAREGGEACTALQTATRQFCFLSIRPHYSFTWPVSEPRTASLHFWASISRALPGPLAVAHWWQNLHHSGALPASQPQKTVPQDLCCGLFAHRVKRCWGHWCNKKLNGLLDWPRQERKGGTSRQRGSHREESRCARDASQTRMNRTHNGRVVKVTW